MLIIPAATLDAFGRFVGNRRQSNLLLVLVFALLVIGASVFLLIAALRLVFVLTLSKDFLLVPDPVTLSFAVQECDKDIIIEHFVRGALVPEDKTVKAIDGGVVACQ